MPGFLSLSQLHAKLEVPSWSIIKYGKDYFLCILKKYVRFTFYFSLLATTLKLQKTAKLLGQQNSTQY
jgi:hypothetical protein